jgi:hypothetical protein
MLPGIDNRDGDRCLGVLRMAIGLRIESLEIGADVIQQMVVAIQIDHVG